MPTVPTVSGRQVESRGFQSPGFQAFEQPNVGDVISQVAPKAIDMFAQAKRRSFTGGQFKAQSGRRGFKDTAL